MIKHTFHSNPLVIIKLLIIGSFEMNLQNWFRIYFFNQRAYIPESRNFQKSKCYFVLETNIIAQWMIQKYSGKPLFIRETWRNSKTICISSFFLPQHNFDKKTSKRPFLSILAEQPLSSRSKFMIEIGSTTAVQQNSIVYLNVHSMSWIFL